MSQQLWRKCGDEQLDIKVLRTISRKLLDLNLRGTIVGPADRAPLSKAVIELDMTAGCLCGTPGAEDKCTISVLPKRNRLKITSTKKSLPHKLTTVLYDMEFFKA